MRNLLHFGKASVAAALCFLSCKPVRAQNATVGFDVFVTPSNNEAVAAGSDYDIIWTPSSPAGKVTIRLMQGATELTQNFGITVASGIDSTTGKYTWSVPSSYGDFPSCGFKLQLDSDSTIFQYSYPFRIIKATAASSPTPSTPSPIVASTEIVPVSISATVTVQVTRSDSNVRSSVSDSTTLSPIPSSSIGTTPAKTTTSEDISANSVQTGTATSTTSATTPAQPLNSNVANNNLSTAAKAGIAIGAAIGVCIICILVYIALQMRRRRNNTERKKEVGELETTTIHEVDGQCSAKELSAGWNGVELDPENSLCTVHELG